MTVDWMSFRRLAPAPTSSSATALRMLDCTCFTNCTSTSACNRAREIVLI